MNVRISAAKKGKYWNEWQVSTHEHILRSGILNAGRVAAKSRTSVISVRPLLQCKDELYLQRHLPFSPSYVPEKGMSSGQIFSLIHFRQEDMAWKLLLNVKLRSSDHTSMDVDKNVNKKSPFLFSFDYKVHVQLSPFTLLMSQLTTKLTIIIQHLHAEEIYQCKGSRFHPFRLVAHLAEKPEQIMQCIQCWWWGYMLLNEGIGKFIYKSVLSII